MPYTDGSAKTLLFGSTDVQLLDGVYVTGFAGLYAPGLRKSSDIDLEYRQGSIPVPGLKYGAYTLSVFVYLEGETPAEFEANLAAAVAALQGTDGLGQLTRRLDTDTGYDETYANGRFVASSGFTQLNTWAGTTELQFVNLSGAWTAGDPNDPAATWVL